MTIREAAAGLRARRFSAVELTTAAMARIDRHNPNLRAFITITAEQALEQARQADREFAMGKDRGPFHGIPVALKDLFSRQGSAHHGGLQGLRKLRAGSQRHGGGETGGGGRGAAGQAQYARTGLRDHVGQPALRRGAQSVEPAAQSGRIERRFGRRGGDQYGLHGDGQRYRRLDPHPGVVLRDRGTQAHLWARQPLRRAAAGLQPGPRGAAHALGARCRADA